MSIIAFRQRFCLQAAILAPATSCPTLQLTRLHLRLTSSTTSSAIAARISDTFAAGFTINRPATTTTRLEQAVSYRTRTHPKTATTSKSTREVDRQDKTTRTRNSGGMAKHERTESQVDVLRHPPTKRAKEIDADGPYDSILEILEKQAPAGSNDKDGNPSNVLHWFRQDLRAEDNRALEAASQKAQETGGTLLTCFLFSPKDLEWHGESPARVDFILESLRLLREQLDGLNIPLAILTAEKRADKGTMLMDFLQENNIGYLFANFEYEVDELRRDEDLLKRLAGGTHKKKTKGAIAHMSLFHDQTVMIPKTLVTGSGGPIKVFTPYHKAWLADVGEDPSLLDESQLPRANSEDARTDFKSLFDTQIPDVPESKRFASDKERDRVRKLWPAGHKAARERLDHFLNKKVATYMETRSNPAKNSSSRLSPYFSAGVLSAREALGAARKANSDQNFDSSGGPGIASWARELVFREFYRHMMVVSPHDSMNLPHNLKFDNVKWEEDEEGWKKWCEGKTGSPFVDAGMRQLAAEAYMHNRLRMNVASYLRCNLLIDYRRGERYFAETLVDWDLCNNTQGWEPSYTVFNPVSQAERNDPDGDYIRRWVPELRGVEGKAVFDPYNRLEKAEFEKLGYPAPHIDFAKSKDRCVQRFKKDLAEADP